MPRQARSASGTGIYHIMMRGVNRRNIFDDDEDHEQQGSIILWLRKEGASVRQIVSHTGFTTKQVRTLADKKKQRWSKTLTGS